MPELPEVETVRNGLEQLIRGATIRQVLVKRRDLRIPFPRNLADALAGRRIVSLGRRAKYLLLHLDNGVVLIIHLGMSGRFLIEQSPPKNYGKHDHVVFLLKDGRALIFNDARRFGLMALTTEKELPEHPFFVHLGPEPFDKAFSARYLKQALARRKGPIKPVIMDQKLVVGVGNIYASEALFEARIDPRKPAASVADRAGPLAAAIRKVLRKAIESGGSSLRDFLHITGKTGDFQHRFNVYWRAGEACNRCGTPIEMLRQAGRATYFCPHCQH